MAQHRLSGDRRLSRYVIETSHRGRRVFHDTVSGRLISATATEAELQAAGMLSGQEESTLWARLTRPRRTLALTLVVTWECNLRCTHCSVRDKLRRQDPDRIDPVRLARFVEAFRHTRPETRELSVSLLGGEPLLRPEESAALLDATRGLLEDHHSSVTTNLAIPLREPELALLERLDEIIVSLDGMEAAHNEQRRPYRDSFNPFRRSVENLGILRDAGLCGKVHVQGAIRDEFADQQHFHDFHRMLVRLGVPYDQIRFDTVHPAEKGLELQETYLQSLRQPLLRREPCCKFRGGSSLVVGSDGTLYSDFYTWETLGSLDDEPGDVLARQREMIRSGMPALRDPGCQACPVIGFCWGGCVNGHLVVGDRPSAFCNQTALIDRVRQLAADGEIVDKREDQGAVGRAANDPRDQLTGSTRIRAGRQSGSGLDPG